MDKIFTEPERSRLKRMVEYLFSPIQGKVEIEKRGKGRPIFESIDVHNEENARHDTYRVSFLSVRGNAEIDIEFANSNLRLSVYAWEIGERIYNEISKELGMERVFVENWIWPRDNDMQPDYDALEQID